MNTIPIVLKTDPIQRGNKFIFCYLKLINNKLYNLCINIHKSASRYVPHTAGLARGRVNLVLRHSLLSAEFWSHYVVSGGTQRRALLRYQSEQMKILM